MKTMQINDDEEDGWGQLAATFPEPQTMEDVLGLYGVTNPDPLVCTNKIESMVKRLKTIRSSIFELQEIEKELKDQIAVFMKDRETLVSPDGEIIVTWKLAQSSEVFDAKLFRAEHQQLYQKYLKQKEGTRRFLVK